MDSIDCAPVDARSPALPASWLDRSGAGLDDTESRVDNGSSRVRRNWSRVVLWEQEVE